MHRHRVSQPPPRRRRRLEPALGPGAAAPNRPRSCGRGHQLLLICSGLSELGRAERLRPLAPPGGAAGSVPPAGGRGGRRRSPQRALAQRSMRGRSLRAGCMPAHRLPACASWRAVAHPARHSASPAHHGATAAMAAAAAMAVCRLLAGRAQSVERASRQCSELRGGARPGAGARGVC